MGRIWYPKLTRITGPYTTTVTMGNSERWDTFGHGTFQLQTMQTPPNHQLLDLCHKPHQPYIQTAFITAVSFLLHKITIPMRSSSQTLDDPTSWLTNLYSLPRQKNLLVYWRIETSFYDMNMKPIQRQINFDVLIPFELTRIPFHHIKALLFLTPLGKKRREGFQRTTLGESSHFSFKCNTATIVTIQNDPIQFNTIHVILWCFESSLQVQKHSSIQGEVFKGCTDVHPNWCSSLLGRHFFKQLDSQNLKLRKIALKATAPFQLAQMGGKRLWRVVSLLSFFTFLAIRFRLQYTGGLCWPLTLVLPHFCKDQHPTFTAKSRDFCMIYLSIQCQHP